MTSRSRVPMENIVFQQLSKVRLLNYIGVTCGRLVPEGMIFYEVLHLEMAGHALRHHLGINYNPADPKYIKLLTDIQAAGVMPSFTEVAQAAKKCYIPPNFDLKGFDFFVCTIPECRNPIRHGHMTKNGRLIAQDIGSLETGFLELNELVKDQRLSPAKAIALFQMMVGANLLLTALEEQKAVNHQTLN